MKEDKALRTKIVDVLLANTLKCIFQASHSKNQFHCIMQPPNKHEKLENLFISSINIKAEDFTVTIGIGWHSENMKVHISKGIRRETAEVNLDLAKGFIGELCNGIAGAIKADLASYGPKLKLGLPEFTGTYDKDKWKKDFVFEISDEKGGVLCFFHIDNWQSNELQKILGGQSIDGQQDEGEIEFL
ncbi:MAG: hypothetical protein CMP10_19890 [Zetaproteobacteria bacterium]|nr:hypothetical protein [Pseudobdellovibrionaceae bacterium]|tara:strand:+ start:247 stop:807 length:561 start_codon:yes stop_codon:yes gene_type:complete